jgi:hypothetical protein
VLQVSARERKLFVGLLAVTLRRFCCVFSILTHKSSERLLMFVAATTLAACVLGHGAITYPPSRNAIDSDQMPWGGKVPTPVRFGVCHTLSAGFCVACRKVGSQTAVMQGLGAVRVTAEYDRLGWKGRVLLTLALVLISYQPALILSESRRVFINE